MNYHPFGMVMPGRNYEASKYRYGFNNKEKDDEIKGVSNSIDFGARVYDPRLGRFLSLDPSQAKYPFISPYHGVGNNPIFIRDNDGGDNIIYLVLLPSSSSVISREDAESIKNKANENLKNMGLKTQVVIFEGTDFNPKYMDKTDAVAVIGSSKELVTYVNDQLENPRFSDRCKIDYQAGASEVSENYDSPNGQGGQIITLNSDVITKDADSFKSSKTEFGGFLINHGAGHNAGENENADYANVMFEAELVKGLIRPGLEVNTTNYGTRSFSNDKFKKLTDFMSFEGNPGHKYKMEKRFFINAPSDNYYKNMAAKNSHHPPPITDELKGQH